MSSYSVEYSLKELILSSNKINVEIDYTRNKKIRNTHDVLKLYEFCVLNDILPNDLLSRDLLTYLSLSFNRYPSDFSKNYKTIDKENMKYYLSIDYLRIFDNLILILDNEIVFRKDKHNSIIYKAINEFDVNTSRILFHQNPYALDLKDEYIKLFRIENEQRYKKFVQFFEAYDISVYKIDRLLPFSMENIDWNLAKNYKTETG